MDKKLFMKVQNKRPLTVSSIFLSLITKVLHKRIDSICEKRGFCGLVLYGLRSERSILDCMLMILAVINGPEGSIDLY